MSLEILDWFDFLRNPGSRESPTIPESAITIGVFDGLHQGHKALIERIVCRGPNPTVVSFRENPKKVVSPETYEGDLFSLKQKLAVFEQLGVSRVILIDFSENFSKLSGREFFELLEDRGKMAFLVIGSNFRCGFRQDTDADFIREMNKRKGIPTEIIPPVTLAGEFGKGLVSSSRIRSAIISGDLKKASVLMGRNVELDLSDIKPEFVDTDKLKGLVYDLRSVHRIVPASGQYSVIMYPGKISGRAVTENGKVFLYGKSDLPVESLEFIEFPI